MRDGDITLTSLQGPRPCDSDGYDDRPTRHYLLRSGLPVKGFCNLLWPNSRGCGIPRVRCALCISAAIAVPPDIGLPERATVIHTHTTFPNSISQQRASSAKFVRLPPPPIFRETVANERGRPAFYRLSSEREYFLCGSSFSVVNGERSKDRRQERVSSTENWRRTAIYRFLIPLGTYRKLSAPVSYERKAVHGWPIHLASRLLVRNR